MLCCAVQVALEVVVLCCAIKPLCAWNAEACATTSRYGMLTQTDYRVDTLRGSDQSVSLVPLAPPQHAHIPAL